MVMMAATMALNSLDFDDGPELYTLLVLHVYCLPVYRNLKHLKKNYITPGSGGSFSTR